MYSVLLSLAGVVLIRKDDLVDGRIVIGAARCCHWSHGRRRTIFKVSLIMAVHLWASRYILQLWFLSFFFFFFLSVFFFLAYCERSEIGCLPYFHT